MIAPHNFRQWQGRIAVGSLSLLLLVMLFGLTHGAAPISMTQVMQWVLGQADPQTVIILEQLRLPRVLLALTVGALLACCGAVTQGLFRNPLADPSLIGVSAGAAAGAAAVVVFLNQQTAPWLGVSMMSMGAFLGGVTAVWLVQRIAGGARNGSVATLLLAGIGITFLAGSLASLFEYMADQHALRQISLWRMGGLEAASYRGVLLSAALLLVLLVVLLRCSEPLNALLLGEAEARHLGVSVAHLKRVIVVCVAAGIGVCVALTGTIAFIGLVVPHIVRMVVGPNHRVLLPLCACYGAILLIVADLVARLVIAPTELPVGLVTAFIGAPLFIMLLRQRQMGHWGGV